MAHSKGPGTIKGEWGSTIGNWGTVVYVCPGLQIQGQPGQLSRTLSQKSAERVAQWSNAPGLHPWY